MGAKGTGRPGLTITTMRLPDDLLDRAARRAERSGITRTRYVEELIRKDLDKNTRTGTAPAREVKTGVSVSRAMEESDDIFG